MRTDLRRRSWGPGFRLDNTDKLKAPHERGADALHLGEA
jgi:hypothetical protein